MNYPPVNGQSDPILSGTFCKNEWLEEVQEINILWNVFNSDECINSTQVFRPNHFCAMIRPSDLDEPVIIENIPEEQVVQESENPQQNAIPIEEFQAVNDTFKLLSDTTNNFPFTASLKNGNKTGKQFKMAHENSWPKFLKGKNFENPPDDKSSYKSKCKIKTYTYNIVDGELIQQTNIEYVGTGKKFINSKTKKEISADEMKGKIVARYTTQINIGQPNLKRRTTYFIIAPEDYSHLLSTCFVEYCGLDTDKGSSKHIHGNCRNLNKPYHK